MSTDSLFELPELQPRVGERASSTPAARFEPAEVMSTPIVSVVIPTYRRPALLQRCLMALFAQDLPPSAYEILVADDAPCEETLRLVERLAERGAATGHTLRYIRNARGRGPAAARNAGWRAARGTIIAFTDDDCIPSPGWLRAGVEALRAGVVGASGRLVVPLAAAPSDYERNAAQLQHASFVTANCFYRREALAAIGGFDERFALAWREDSDVYFRLSEVGARLVAAPEAVVVHPVRRARWGVSIGQQRKSFYNALLYKKHPALYRQHVQAAPPWRYYGIVLSLGVLAIGVLRSKPRWTFCGAACWTWLTGDFCARRLRGASHAPAHVAEMVVTSALIPPLAIYWRLRGALKFRVWFL